MSDASRRNSRNFKMAQSGQVLFFFEDVLPKTGWGLYYKFMVGIASACNFVQAVSLLSIYFGAHVCLSDAQANARLISGVYIIFSCGRAIGGFMVNKMMDVYGRKRVISFTLFMIFLATFTAAFGYNYYIVLLAVFVIGAGLEGNICVMMVHLSEILPKDKRAYYLVFCNIFWTLGYLSILVFSILISNHMVVDNQVLDMKLSSWRLIFVMAGSLNLIIACASALLEESPRWFLLMKKPYLAALTLKQFYAINRSRYGETFDVREMDLYGLIDDHDMSVDQMSNNLWGELKKYVHLMYASMKLLFKRPFLRTSLILIAVKTPLLFTGMVEMNIALARSLDASPELRNSTNLMCMSNFSDNATCSDYYYYNLFVVAINILVGQILTMLILDRLGRRLVLVLSLLISGSSLIFLNFTESSMTKIILSTQAMLALSSAMSTVSVINVEAFPTALRGMACGLTNFLGLLSSSFFHEFNIKLIDIRFIIIGSSYLGASIAAYFVQDLKRQPMIE